MPSCAAVACGPRPVPGGDRGHGAPLRPLHRRDDVVDRDRGAAEDAPADALAHDDLTCMTARCHVTHPLLGGAPHGPLTVTAAAHPAVEVASYAPAVRIDLATIVVDDYDRAVEFFVGALGFELVEDSAALTNDGRPKRWVVVRPPGAETGHPPRPRRRRAPGRGGREPDGGPGRLLPPGRRLRRRPRADAHRGRRVRQPRHATSPTDGSPCSSTSPATDGTSSAPPDL